MFEPCLLKTVLPGCCKVAIIDLATWGKHGTLWPCLLLVIHQLEEPIFTKTKQFLGCAHLYRGTPKKDPLAVIALCLGFLSCQDAHSTSTLPLVSSKQLGMIQNPSFDDQPPIMFFHGSKSAVHNGLYYIQHIPVVPHKAVAEVSQQETYRRGWLL